MVGQPADLFEGRRLGAEDNATGRAKAGRALLGTVIGALLLLSVAYGGDYLWLRLRLLLHRNPYSILTVQPFYAVPNKDAKGEQYFFLDPQTQTCVRSLFPHFGYTPCWYLNRHKQRRISV